MRLGIMYVKQLKDRLNELEINEVFGDKVMDQLREICHEHGKYVIRINK
jgi:uncharacterized coiled-coil protein SlyX